MWRHEGGDSGGVIETGGGGGVLWLPCSIMAPQDKELLGMREPKGGMMIEMGRVRSKRRKKDDGNTVASREGEI